MENTQSYVTLTVADGSKMDAYIATPALPNQNSPAIILLQEAFGVNHHIRTVANKYAADGYIVIAPELFHRTAPKHLEISYDNFDGIMPYLKALTNEGIEADLNATYQWLAENENADNEKIYSVGYCMGGRVSFIANAILPLRAAVSYYGGGLNQFTNKAKDLHGPHLFFWGGKDHHIKTEQIDAVINAVDEAGKDYINVKISYADHGFNCNERASYNEKAAKEALALTLTFLKNNE